MSFGPKAAERLKDQVILITGASAGIGWATAKEFAEAANGEIKLILTARRLEKLDQLKTELVKEYPGIKVLIAELDVGKIAEIQPFINSLPEEFADIDVLINNAGTARGVEKVGDIQQEDINTMFGINVLGLIAMTQAVLPSMKKRNTGDVVNLGSIAGREAYPGGGIYCATKAAIRSFTESLRKELIDTKIRVIEIDPGNVETEFSNVRFRGDLDKAKSVYANTEPLYAEDISDLIVYAVSRKQKVVIADTLVFSTNQAGPFHLYRGN